MLESDKHADLASRLGLWSLKLVAWIESPGIMCSSLAWYCSARCGYKVTGGNYQAGQAKAPSPHEARLMWDKEGLTGHLASVPAKLVSKTFSSH